MDKNYYIKNLRLIPHPEGGYYREVYRSNEILKNENLPSRYNGDRCFGTSIYYLIDGDNFSSFHKLKSDEIWHFYAGSPLILHIIYPNGNYSEIKLGNDVLKDEKFQITVPLNSWFAAETSDKNSFSLVGANVSPGFEFDDFELAKREDLVLEYPNLTGIINKLTRK